MKLLHMILSGSAALIAVINGCADAVDANTVSAASDLQERMLNEQNNEPNGIGIGITSPQHESKSGKSKSAKNGSNNVNVIDKVVAFALFRTYVYLTRGLVTNHGSRLFTRQRRQPTITNKINTLLHPSIINQR